MPVHFHREDSKHRLREVRKIRRWILQCILNESKSEGDINVVLCSDDYLLTMNRKHLNHDYFTDIITFDYCSGDVISGDLFISIDRVKDNAALHKGTISNELHRVIIHGILHLLGYSDKTKEDKKTMRSKEDSYLTLLAQY